MALDTISHTLSNITGSNFCPSIEKSKVMVEVYYGDLSYRIMTEFEAYPLILMLNDMTGIFNLYFGFSMLSMSILLQTAWRFQTKFKKTLSVSRSVNNEMDTLPEYKGSYREAVRNVFPDV